MTANLRWTVIALWTIGMSTALALALTASVQDGAAWWQAILSGSALLASVMFWRMDRDRERTIADAERARAEAERLAKFRSMAILILDPVLEIDSWVRELIRREAGPSDKVQIGERQYQIVKTVKPIPAIMSEISNLYHLEGDAAPLQRAVFRYLQLGQVLKDGHDETAQVQTGVGISKEAFQSTLQLIHEDIDLFLKALHLALWNNHPEADAFVKRRAERMDQLREARQAAA